MRLLPLLLLTSVVLVPSTALAKSRSARLLEQADVLLADYHPAAPLTPGRPVPSPVAPAPLRHARADFFLLGLGLVAGGLVLGGAGFAVLYACREGTACYSDTTTVIGWVLAAPGIIPLTVGLIMMWAASGSSGRVTTPKTAPTQTWAFNVLPLRDGALVSAAAVF
jgi:hypothetical protein